MLKSIFLRYFDDNDTQRQARKALKEYNILLHSNSNKLTDGYSSLHQTQEVMRKMYETAKLNCKPKESNDNDKDKEKDSKTDNSNDNNNGDDNKEQQQGQKEAKMEDTTYTNNDNIYEHQIWKQ